MDEAAAVAVEIGSFPLIVRPAFTLGGAGGGIAYNREELEEIVRRGLDLSPVTEVLIEESLLGWKEFEMEVMRDRADNCVVICSIENLDPMGIHTGDSITVAPIQTVSAATSARMRLEGESRTIGDSVKVAFIWRISAPYRQVTALGPFGATQRRAGFPTRRRPADRTVRPPLENSFGRASILASRLYGPAARQSLALQKPKRTLLGQKMRDTALTSP
jgi:hypothetical protein